MWQIETHQSIRGQRSRLPMRQQNEIHQSIRSQLQPRKRYLHWSEKSPATHLAVKGGLSYDPYLPNG